jgi:hypothetical protein
MSFQQARIKKQASGMLDACSLNLVCMVWLVG